MKYKIHESISHVSAMLFSINFDICANTMHNNVLGVFFFFFSLFLKEYLPYRRSSQLTRIA